MNKILEKNNLKMTEPSGSQGELIIDPLSWRPSVGVRPPFSKIVFSETAWPI